MLGENPTIDSATNRFAAGQGYGYDNSGNLTNAPGNKQYVYDAENQQTHYSDGTNVGDYTYDGEGRRVKRVVNGTTTVMVYNAMGQMMAEYTSSVVELGGGTSYVTSDVLGSTRLLTHSSGDVKSRHDYLPFGEEIGAIGNRSWAQDYVTDNIRQKFTSKERDDESKLDYFLARYYSSAQGRFTGVDPADAEPHVPQSWNRFNYTLNNPLKYTDPTGEKWAIQINDGKAIFKWFEGDSTPTGPGWEGEWNLYSEGWYIGSDEAVRLDPHGPKGVFKLSKDLFSAEDWNKLQRADEAHFTREEQEILFAATSSIVNELPHGRRAMLVNMITTAIAAGGMQARLSRIGVPNAPQIKPPPTPGGMTQGAFGKIVMKWGTGSKDALSRIGSLTREELVDCSKSF